MQKFYRLNQFIQAPILRVLDEKGKQLGIFPRVEALNKAKEIGLDLVEIAPNANPPVAKIIDFKKFKYLEAKREKELKKKTKETEVKEIHIRPFIGKHDIEIRLNQAKEFLSSGKRLKIVIKFHGREMGKKEAAYTLIKRITEALALEGEPWNNPKWEGRNLVLLLNPKEKNKK